MSVPTSKVYVSVKQNKDNGKKSYKLWSCGAYHYKLSPKVVNRFRVDGVDVQKDDH